MQNGTGSGAIVAVGQAKAAIPGALETQTKAIGVILPPPDIRAIVDKTAQFVARNGVEFEKRILSNEANNQKFNFLKDGDPYNAYYRQKVADFGAADKAGEAGEHGVAAASGVAPTSAAVAPVPAPAVLAPVIDKVKAALPPTKPLEAPEAEQYSVHIPEGLTVLDLDTIKLTAQFVARNGKSFLTGLASREHANPQFHFLKPTHSLFGFFTTLCDAYSRVLMPHKDLHARLDKDMTDRAVILERALRRLEWERAQETEAKAKAAREEAEREAMLSVDWHEFAVVETIEFYDDETDELPALMTVKDIMRMAKAGMQYKEPEPEVAAAAAAAAQEQHMEMDDEERALVAQGVGAGAGTQPIADVDMDMDVSDDEGVKAAAGAPEEVVEGPMRVVKNYQRAAPRQQQQYDPTKMVVSPITGELVPIGEMAEHMRISLIDPKYREQKEAMMAKIRDTAKASDDEIGKNLVSLSRTLPHIFGTTAEEMTALVGKQIAEQRAKDAVAARAALPASVPQGPAQPLPPPSAPLPEMPQVAVPPPGMAPPLQAPAAPPPSLPLPSPVPLQAAPPPAAPPGLRPAAPPPAAAPAAPPPAAAPPAVVALPPATAAAPPRQPPPAAMAPPPMRPPAPMPLPTMPRPPMPHIPMGVPTTRGPPLPPMPYGGSPPLPQDAPPLPEDELGNKRRADTFVLMPEEEFADQHPGQQKVYVLCPTVEGSETLKGHLLAVEMPSLMASVGDLKARLSEVLALPPGRQQLSREHVGILKNELTLAFYNVGTEVQLQLGLKERGGRKK